MDLTRGWRDHFTRGWAFGGVCAGSLSGGVVQLGGPWWALGVIAFWPIFWLMVGSLHEEPTERERLRELENAARDAEKNLRVIHAANGEIEDAPRRMVEEDIPSSFQAWLGLRRALHEEDEDA